jgi:hypothetical protein
MFSPALRARRKKTICPPWWSCTPLVGESVNVTQPSGPVARSGGRLEGATGIRSTNTSAPCTELLWLSETWKRAVTGWRDPSGLGEKEARSMISLFGSEIRWIGIAEPVTGATTPVGPDVAEVLPLAFFASAL